jgi:hypothetical protein
MSKTNSDGILTERQANSLRGCGAGTENECFALHESCWVTSCLMVVDQSAAGNRWIFTGGRMNASQEEGIVYCPLGVLGNSKIDPSTK